MSAKSSFKIPADLEDYLERLVSAVERAVDGNTANKPEGDWRTKYLSLQEQYRALSALYQSIVETPPVADKNNEYLISFDAKPTLEETATVGIVQIKDLLNVAIESNTSDIFDVLSYYLANTKGDFQELVKIQKKAYNEKVMSKFTSNLAISKTFSKIDCIRVFRSLIDAGKIVTRDGSKLTHKAYFSAVGDFFGVDLSDAATVFSASLSDGNSGTKHTAIFDQLSSVILDQFNAK